MRCCSTRFMSALTLTGKWNGKNDAYIFDLLVKDVLYFQLGLTAFEHYTSSMRVLIIPDDQFYMVSF